VPKDTKKAIISPSVSKLEQVEAPSPARDEVKEIHVEEPEHAEEIEVETSQPAVPEKSEVELKAEKITDAQIKKYWKDIESQRIAPRVHQQDLDLSEKILRYFDVSSQYGVSQFHDAQSLGIMKCEQANTKMCYSLALVLPVSIDGIELSGWASSPQWRFSLFF
jgi:DNA polymerase delta subunit 4